jgi:hypothetical protein
MDPLLLNIFIWSGFVYLILGVIIASSLAAFNAGTNGTGYWSPFDWLLTVVFWLPFITRAILKLFGPLFLALLAHPFRRR